MSPDHHDHDTETPAAESSSLAALPSAAEPAKPWTKTILVVDANPRTRGSRVTSMSERGVTVHSAGTAAAALVRFSSGTYDLVLIDPGEDTNGANRLVQELRLRKPRQMVAFFVGGPPFVKMLPTPKRASGIRAVPDKAETQEAPVPRGAAFDFGEKIREAETSASAEAMTRSLLEK